MELKNQILLVILVPIILILFLAILQVGLLGFVSIPSFQDSLLEFHINRHINGLTIEMNIIEQEIYIQYQAYFNQLFGVSAHLRYYCFGEFQNYSNWTLDPMQIAPHSFTSDDNISTDYQVAWHHDDYTSLADLKVRNPQLFFLLTKGSQSLTLTDIIINNTRSLKQDLQLASNSSTNSSSGTQTDNETLVPINYASTMIHCTNSLVIRFPNFDKNQQKLLNNFNISSWLPQEKFILDNSLNFTMHYNPDDPFTSGPAVQITQIVFDDKKTQCFMTAKVLNSYLEDLTVRHLEQHVSQGEQEHQLFTAIINPDNTLTSLSPSNYSNINMTKSICQYIIDTKGMQPHSMDDLIQTIDPVLVSTINQLMTNASLNSTIGSVSYSSYKFYFLVSEVIINSTKLVSVVTAPENGRKYVYIQPQQNNFSMPTFILVHYFEESVLIQELYEGTSLNNVKILEIIVLIVIIVLSIIIFLFVWYTATRIGLSFEQPIKVLTDFMNNIDIQNMDQEEELINYQDYFNSFEIKSLFQTMNIFVTTIKYSNQKYSNSKHSDAIALMELSRAKDFYKKEIGNMSAVGICANNIGILHMKGSRWFEAVNEMEEAIYIAKLELIEIKELKKWCTDMQRDLSEPNLYQNFKLRIKGFANKFRQQMEFNWNNRNSRNKSEQKSKVSNTNSKKTKNVSTTGINSKSALPIAFHSSTNQNTTLLKNSQQISMQPSSHSTPHNKRVITDRSLAGDFNLNSNNSNNARKPLNAISQIDNESSPLQSPNISQSKMRYFGQNQSSIIQSQRMEMNQNMLDGVDDKKMLDSGEVEERQRQDSNTSEGNMSELQMIEEKLSELAKKKKLVKAKLQNRQFQLAQFMFTICMQFNDVFIPETLKLFNDFENQATKDQRMTQSKIVRLINLHVKKALCYIQLGDLDSFSKSEKKAEELYQRLTCDNPDFDPQNEEQDFNFVDMFKNVPKEVLLSKIKQLKAIYQLLQGNFKTAAQILTDIIEMGEYYDPEVRDFCLVVLENIFKLFKISTKPIQQFRNQISINVYEIVLMVDYSKEMNIEQINLAHKLSTEIFQILQPQDLVGMYGFNDSLHEAFPLQPKGTYKDLLNKQLSMAITAPGGNSKLYQALRFAIRNFFEHKINIQDGHMFKKKQSADLNGKDSVKNDIAEDNDGELEAPQFRSTNEEPVIDSEIQEEDSSDEDQDEEEFQFLRFKNGQADDQKQTQNQDTEEQDFRNRYKFICIFTEIVKLPTPKQEAKLKRLLEKNQVDLMVFNIANQNATMLDLKKLSKITPRSIFVNANANLGQLFGKSRQNQLQKKMYLEFF